MAYFPVVGDLIECRICCYTPDQIALNILHMRVTARTGSGCSLDEIAQILDSYFAPVYKTLMPDEAKYRGIGVSVIGPPRTIEYSFVGNDGVGTVSSTLLPNQTTYLVQKRSQWAGKENLGRIYPGFPPAAAADANGKLNAGYAAQIATLATLLNTFVPVLGMVGGGGDTDVKQVIRHKSGATVDIDNFVASDRFATQRRRGQYGKENVLPF